MELNNQFFKKTIIFFWGAWWLIAFWTDLVGGLTHLGMMHASWAPDTNYPFLVESLRMYHLPSWVPTFLFIGILAWSLLSMLAFFWACLSFHKEKKIWLRRAGIAFIISLTLWLAFFISDQMVMKFNEEQNHMVQGGFELLCFFALYLLP